MMPLGLICDQKGQTPHGSAIRFPPGFMCVKVPSPNLMKKAANGDGREPPFCPRSHCEWYSSFLSLRLWATLWHAPNWYFSMENGSHSTCEYVLSHSLLNEILFPLVHITMPLLRILISVWGKNQNITTVNPMTTCLSADPVCHWGGEWWCLVYTLLELRKIQLS